MNRKKIKHEKELEAYIQRALKIRQKQKALAKKIQQNRSKSKRKK